MTDEWLTYAEAAERLHTTPQGARQRAIRGRWQKTIGNDKKPRIRLPDGWADTVRTVTEHAARKSANAVRTPTEHGWNAVRTATEHAIDPALVDSLRDHVATLKAENETLKAQLAASEERTTATEARVTAADARAADEAAKTAQAIAAFESLAQRLEAIAEAKRPAWRRWLGLAG
jgi:hypothetical protein